MNKLLRALGVVYAIGFSYRGQGQGGMSHDAHLFAFICCIIAACHGRWWTALAFAVLA